MELLFLRLSFIHLLKVLFNTLFPQTPLYIEKAARLIDKQLLVCPALMGSKTPPQNSAKAKKLGRGRAAHKSPIGEG